MKNITTAATALLALGGAALAQSQFILMPDSTADKIVKFDAFNGALIDADFILDANNPLTYDFSTPKDVFQVNDQIWVIDQIADSLFRFDSSGNWIGTTNGPTGTLDNCRGGEFVNGVVYVTNDGSGNGATVDTVVMFNTSGVKIGQFSVVDSGNSPFDVVGYAGELLVCHFTAANKIGRYDYAGNPLLPPFHVSDGVTGIDSPEQLWVSAANTVFASGFAAPIGIYEYDSTGTQINYYSNSVFLRGVCELGNGKLLFSDSQGAKIYDIGSGTATPVYTSTGCQFFGAFSFAGPTPTAYCTAGTTTNGCVPSISANNQPSVSFANPCDITVANVEGQKSGILFYGINGQQSAPWGVGGTSFLCVKAPTQRTGAQISGGNVSQCDGSLVLDWNSYQMSHPSALGQPWSSGNMAWVQGWFRDPPAVKTTNLSDGLEMTYVP